MKTVRVFLLDAGGCGACAAEVWTTVELSPELSWAPGPGHTDVVALTGSPLPSIRAAVLALVREFFAGRIPIIVVGRCALDGYPYGQTGVRTLSDIPIHAKLEACPPLPSIMLETFVDAAGALEHRDHVL